MLWGFSAGYMGIPGFVVDRWRMLGFIYTGFLDGGVRDGVRDGVWRVLGDGFDTLGRDTVIISAS